MTTVPGKLVHIVIAFLRAIGEIDAGKTYELALRSASVGMGSWI